MRGVEGRQLDNIWAKVKVETAEDNGKTALSYVEGESRTGTCN